MKCEKIQSKSTQKGCSQPPFCKLHLLFSIVFKGEFEILFRLLQIFSAFFLIAHSFFEKNSPSLSLKTKFSSKNCECFLLFYCTNIPLLHKLLAVPQKTTSPNKPHSSFLSFLNKEKPQVYSHSVEFFHHPS